MLCRSSRARQSPAAGAATGIGVIGVFTATVASDFLQGDQETDLAQIERRLERLERQVRDVHQAVCADRAESRKKPVLP